eukprot:Pgem_evm2s844
MFSFIFPVTIFASSLIISDAIPTYEKGMNLTEYNQRYSEQTFFQTTVFEATKDILKAEKGGIYTGEHEMDVNEALIKIFGERAVFRASQTCTTPQTFGSWGLHFEVFGKTDYNIKIDATSEGVYGSLNFYELENSNKKTTLPWSCNDEKSNAKLMLNNQYIKQEDNDSERMLLFYYIDS